MGIFSSVESASVAVNLTSAQLANLGTTPVSILGAQGAGTVIVPVSATMQYRPGTVAFLNTPDLVIKVGNTIGTFSGLGLNALVDKVCRSSLGTTAIVSPNTALTVSSATAVGQRGPIATSSLNNGGNFWLPADTATIDQGTGGLITVSTVSNSFPITAVSQVGKTFTVTGDASALAIFFSVYRSTGNDGNYTVISAVFAAGSTVITVAEDIPSATADGSGGDPNAGSVGSITAYALTNAGTGYGVGVVGLTPVSPSVGSGAVNVLTITSASDGTARVEVVYYVMNLA